MLVLLVYQLLCTPSWAVENGTPTLGDPNAVAVNGAGGFLYAPRIILTTAHNHINTETTVWLVGMPGEPWTSNSKKVTAKKVFLASSYKDRTYLSGGNVFSRTDDFAVIVLDEPIPIRNVVKIATKEELEQFKSAHSTASMVGYGLQNPEMRSESNNGRKLVDVIPQRINANLISDVEAQSIIENSLGSNAVYNMDAYFTQTLNTGSICDNDSGSGWFVDANNLRYYVGPASGGWGFPNCTLGAPWGSHGAFAAVSAAYRFMDLISEAEQYIQEHPVKESNNVVASMNNPDVSTTSIISNKPLKPSKIATLKCVKGKIVKVIKGINPKCPKGYLPHK